MSTFTAEERAAMKEHAKEVKTAARGASPAGKAAHAPALEPKLWHGMPSYALDGKVVCFFQSAERFKARYATLGFGDQAKLDDGPMWAAGFALTDVTPAVEERIAALVTQAVR